MKTVVITLSDAIPDTEMSKEATVTIGTASYAGKVMAIITHEALPATTTVKLSAPGLIVTP